MISTIFPKNPVVLGMEYDNEVLVLHFVKSKKYKLRSYKCDSEENRKLAYKLFYSKTGQQTVDIFNNEIRDKLIVLKVK